MFLYVFSNAPVLAEAKLSQSSGWVGLKMGAVPLRVRPHHLQISVLNSTLKFVCFDAVVFI